MTRFDPGLTDQKAETCDAIVLGGGPGGAAAATWLVEAGLNVVLIEKDHHPRFHIGESLLPQSLPLLQDLGVLEHVQEIGVYKPGAEFISEDGENIQTFLFSRALLPGPDHAYQVLRSEFDKLLFDRALQAGAQVLEGTAAEVAHCTDEGALVRATGPDGLIRHFEAPVLIDASGRSTVTAKIRAEKTPDPHNTSAAIFGHFQGVPRADGPLGGNIRIHLTDPGWMWQIPLRDDVTSVGFVAPGAHLAKRDCGIEQYFRAHCARHPEIARLIGQADLVGEMRATGNFSYRSDTAAGPGHLKVGDAYGFLDPIFSTGVHLALISAREASDAVIQARANPRGREKLFLSYDQNIRRRLNYVSWFIYRIQDPVFREMLLNPRDILGIERAVISLLAGDFRPDLRIRSRVWLFKALRQLASLRKPHEGLQNA